MHENLMVKALRHLSRTLTFHNHPCTYGQHPWQGGHTLLLNKIIIIAQYFIFTKLTFSSHIECTTQLKILKIE